MKQISERIRLSNFKPLLETDYYHFLHKVDYNIITNKLNLSSNFFIRNTYNTNFIYVHFVLPLFKRYHFELIKHSKLAVFTSNNHISYSYSPNSSLKETIKDLKYPYNDENLYTIKDIYQYTSVHQKYVSTNYNDISWADTFNGARRCLRHLQTPRSILKEYMRWCGLKVSTCFETLLDYSIRIVLPFFDDLKRILHQNIDLLPPECRYFFDIPTIAGYPKMENRLLTDNPHEWLTKQSSTLYTSQWWADAFTKTFGQAIIHNPNTLLTLSEFTHNRWLWVTDGATKFSKFEVDGEKMKTKFGAAVSLSNDELDRLVHEAVYRPYTDESMIGIFIKPDEKGYKRRLIANVPLGGYIIASYIRYLIESFVGDTPLFTKLSPTVEEIIDVTVFLKNHKLALPLDESAYDYNVTRESWIGFIDFLESTFVDNYGVKMFKKYFQVAFWHFDGLKGKWLAGMPSGLALTSFLNSWMNYIKQGTIVPGIINWAAGDDVLTFPYDEDIDMNVISTKYSYFGSVANPIKNWKSTRYAEYLKRFYSSTGTSGYPARIWSSIIWAGTERFYLPSDRLPEIAELFKQFFDRIGIHMDERYVAKDLSRAVSNKIEKFNMYTALDWLHSPRIHGGFGKVPYNNRTFTWDVEHVRSKQIVNNLIRVPRFLEYNGTVTLKIGTYHLNTSSYRTGNSYKLAPINTIDEWEKRLNREDVDYHGPFQSLVLDVIPLPTVDFISTSLMSSVASQHYFNSYPNLHGSWNTIASRLVNASLALVSVITTRLSEASLITFI